MIIYDHWEDGYETDITNPKQVTTLVWGDGNPANGVAPGYPNDIIPPGGNIVLDNQFQYNDRDRSILTYDGKDKLYSTTDIVISKVSGDARTLSGNVALFALQNVKSNVYDTEHFGRNYILPVGENTTNNLNLSAFNYVGVFIRAMKDNTLVNFDYRGDGSHILTKTINEGDVWFYDGKASMPGNKANDYNKAQDIQAGAVITANHPIGVDMIFGDIGTYGTRNLTLLPNKFYGHTYYSPVYTTHDAAPVYAFITNTNSNPITINWETGNGNSGALNVAANSTGYLHMNQRAAYKFTSQNQELYTIMAVVDADASGKDYDWSFKMIPEEQLTNFTSVAWAPGSLDLSANYNPIWITAPKATTVYFKYDGDLTAKTTKMSPCGLPYDLKVTMPALGSYKFLNPSNDQSGTAIYTCNEDEPIVAVWGQDALPATPSGQAMDVGYSLMPRCLRERVLANDDWVVTDENTSITIDVLLNDAAFLCTVDKSSLNTMGLLQPANGTIFINPDKTITYTPDPGFSGVDQFEYRLCAIEYPNICDMATVTINVAPCASGDNQNIVKGRVFVDQMPFNNVNDNEKGAQGVRINLYADNNCNGSIDTDEVIVQQTLTDPSGNFSFITRNGHSLKDDFDPNADYTGNDGSVNWGGSWQENGENNGAATGNVQVLSDPISNSNALRLNGGAKGASRVANFSNATHAVLKFSFRRQSVKNNSTLDVKLNSDLIYQATTGTTITDSYYTDIVIPLSATQITGNGANTLQFITGSTTTNTEFFWIDNVELIYYNNHSCFVARIDETSISNRYNIVTLHDTRAYEFTGIGQCSDRKQMVLRAKLVAENDTKNTSSDMPVIINVIDNDLGVPDFTTVAIITSPPNGTATVNPDGTIKYTPNPGYEGTDTFTYTVCSKDDPNVCSTATVTVNISCLSIPNKNVINGLIFNDRDKDGTYDTGEPGIDGISVQLYHDVNNNGVFDAGTDTLVTTQLSNSVGGYQFVITPPTGAAKTYLDRFIWSFFSNQSDGTEDWSGESWHEIGTINGFAFSPITITFWNGLRINGNGTNTELGAYRTANLEGAVVATLSFDYNRVFAPTSPHYVDVLVATSDEPVSWYRLERINSSSEPTDILSYDISDFISANTTIRFVTSGNGMPDTEYVDFDNVKIEFSEPVPAKYIVKLAEPLPAGYGQTMPTTPGVYAVSFTGEGEGFCQQSFGLQYTNYWKGTTGTDWGTAANWTANAIPPTGMDVEFATEENNDNDPAINDLTLDRDRIIGNLTNATTFATIIPPATALTVQGKVTGSESDPKKIIIKASDDGITPNGSMIFDCTNQGTTAVFGTVELFAKGDKGLSQTWTDNIPGSPTNGENFDSEYRWQHFGVPVETIKGLVFYGSFVRKYDETYNGTVHSSHTMTYYAKWRPQSEHSDLTAFAGYEITQETPKIFSIPGKLQFCDKTITMTRRASAVTGATGANVHYGLGQNIFGNSFTSAIKIDRMGIPDPVEKTVYLYNTGSFYQWTGGSTVTGENLLAAGNYIAIPVYNSAIWNNQIPSMQGFLLKFKNETTLFNEPDATVTLRYANGGVVPNTKPQLAPNRVSSFTNGASDETIPADEDTSEVRSYLHIGLASKSTIDNLWLFSQDGTTPNFDDGWDGWKFFGTPTAYIYAETPDGPMQVSTNSTIDGSLITHYPNSDDQYALTLTKNNLDEYTDLHLIDLIDKRVIPLNNDRTTYHFRSSVNHKPTKRFLIVNANDIDLNLGSLPFINAHLAGRKELVVSNFTNEEGILQIYNIQGQHILDKPFGKLESQHTLTLNPGIYVIKLKAGEIQNSVKIVVR